MDKLLNWLRSRDRLLVSALDPRFSAGARVSLRFQRGWHRIALGAASAALIGWGAWALFGEAESQPVLVFPVLLIIGLVPRRQALVLTDEVLAQAAARAAVGLGHQVKQGEWRLEGGAAYAIGAELLRLNKLPTPPSAASGVARLQYRESFLLQAATGPLCAYLLPVLTAPAEPVVLNPASHRPGDPWPVLPCPEQRGLPWPVLETPTG